MRSVYFAASGLLANGCYMKTPKLLKADQRILRSLPRGFFLPCGQIVPRNSRRAAASPCAAHGVLYEIRGDLAAVDLVLCPRHRRSLQLQGLSVRVQAPMFQTLARGTENWKKIIKAEVPA